MVLFILGKTVVNNIYDNTVSVLNNSSGKGYQIA